MTIFFKNSKIRPFLCIGFPKIRREITTNPAKNIYLYAILGEIGRFILKSRDREKEGDIGRLPMKSVGLVNMYFMCLFRDI